MSLEGEFLGFVASVWEQHGKCIQSTDLGILVDVSSGKNYLYIYLKKKTYMRSEDRSKLCAVLYGLLREGQHLLSSNAFNNHFKVM